MAAFCRVFLCACMACDCAPLRLHAKHSKTKQPPPPDTQTNKLKNKVIKGGLPKYVHSVRVASSMGRGSFPVEVSSLLAAIDAARLKA